MITEKQNRIIDVLENEGLEVDGSQEYYIVEDSEGHSITLDFVEDYYAEILDNDLRKTIVSLDQEHLLVTEVLDALDYSLEEVSL
ncbi:PLP-dependent aminotransferase family protein [Staphylococcus phage vB_SsapH-Golestan101-M]|nr:PLP-dependent aminotransferase family protein [Staphylococcus phage vB_SsapH-Golestan101-M]